MSESLQGLPHLSIATGSHLLALSEEHVDAYFDAWGRLLAGSGGTPPRLWRLDSAGKAPHQVATRMVQPGDLYFRVSHRSIKASSSFKASLLSATSAFEGLALANVRVRRDVHNCEAYTVVEKSRNGTKRIATYILCN